MKINLNFVKTFLDVELIQFKKVYEFTQDGKVVIKFTKDTNLKFTDVKSIINLLSHLDKFTKFSQVDSIIKTSVEVQPSQVIYTMWVDDVNIDPFFNGNKEGRDYKEMLKSIKGLVV